VSFGILCAVVRVEKKDVANLTCPHCGASVSKSSKFCAKCGKKLP